MARQDLNLQDLLFVAITFVVSAATPASLHSATRQSH